MLKSHNHYEHDYLFTLTGQASINIHICRKFVRFKCDHPAEATIIAQEGIYLVIGRGIQASLIMLNFCLYYEYYRYSRFTSAISFHL